MNQSLVLTPTDACVALSQRPETDADREFLLGLYGSTRADELALAPWPDAQKTAFVEQQFDAQRSHYRQHYPDADYLVIFDGEVPIGRLYLDRGERQWLVLDIAIVPERRNQGIGESIMRGIMAEAAAAGKPVHLHVESFSRARPFYDRLGFSEAELQGFHYLLVYPPPKPADDSIAQ